MRAFSHERLVYTLFDHHKSTCKPARSRRRQASLSSITSLETENTEDELPPELLRPYERSPSLPILMHAKGSKPSIPETAIEAFTSGDYANEEVDYAIREQISRASEVPDPIQLSKSILDLLASIESSGVQQNPSTTSIDPQALLASLSEPLVVPADFTFPNSEVQSLSSQPLNSEAFESSQPFAYAHLAEQQGPANSTKTFATEYDSLPERLHRAASILQTQTIDPQTINPAYTISPSRINGFQPPAPAQSIFSTQPISTFAPEASTSHSDVHNAPPITNGWRDWSDGSEDDSDGNGHDLSQNFLEQEYNNEAQLLANDDSTWESHIEPEDRQDHISDGAESAGEAGQVVVDDEVNDSSSSDSDIPAEQLLKTTTSNRSYTPVQPLEDHGTWSTNLPVQQENYQPLDNYSPPIDRSPSPVPASARRLAPRKSRASYHQVPQPEVRQADVTGRLSITATHLSAFFQPEEFFDIYNIFPSFEDAEAAIAANARKSGVPLKIRYRPNSLGDSINARKQACLECLCLCGYRIYLKDDHRGQW